MPKKPTTWYRAATGWWMAQVDCKQVKLHEGPNNYKAKRIAARKLHALLKVREAASDPEAKRFTVAGIIDIYLEHAKRYLSKRSLYERKLILQSFAEAHGWRHVNDRACLPFHLTSWIDANPQWQSDWTIAHVIGVVQRPFNWATQQRLLPANPFRSVAHRAGPPRRPLTDAEYKALLAAVENCPNPGSPSPGQRFRDS